ncbi:hypothetical protein A3F00_03085 [Candidatus Daviesbacteria bacterium RIFCSPHIGHO2_12_FULL_37_11]|uniref:Uncharacterized protein n=1 Tax=Candidatus Daviesbacteria bacterium RIFCSPHIGHO2_12_FULL_37_11 TaxID=1797777 RepID=A0A1F5KBG4_9BACT|nr:MAG: hypothetical protein A2111_01670 [Candidatus Daviesbacteria bacterium GWA1_38_6]OGE16980.1 MAG: hypothetical protein A2769_04375 [Candidatus Daviesbacteria bacterium RIFCSPHIGHO2_01_FULL_37_27]OGE38282.1 MAG: hypothetical protein A3F00_03085 [Candidatus Daviesbacteria bacterium RIFCSPHIGHO2_12_FULL_37_11]OGE46238.1 MAG: hypothetical protein A3B39_02850 [Candidatus Daviesbacteria bacterium RIFCSPLOWO2_01_FULL_37_10]
MLKFLNYKIISWIKLANNHRFTVGLAALILVLLIGGFFIFQNYQKSRPLLSDIILNFDPEGPFATLIPRRDGNALVLNIKRVAAYDSFSYQLTYADKNGIDRGAGSLDTWIELKDKGEYEQELLLGTCSQGFTEGKEHCVFDEGVENGTLTLRIRKGLQPYRMLSQWHLQKPDLALGNLTSGDNHFSYKLANAKREDLSLIGFSVVNDLTGAPKLPGDKQILGKVYSLTSPIVRDLAEGSISLELSENPAAGAKLARYTDRANSWEELETKITGSKLEASASGSGIFTVLINKQ